MYSLKQKLHRNLLITVTILMIVLLYVLYQGIQTLTQNYVTSRLFHDADNILAALSQEQNGSWGLSHSRISNIYHRVHSGHYYIVKVNNQSIRSRSLFDIDIKTPVLNLGESHCYTANFSGREQWLTCSQKVKKQGHFITIWVAEDISPLEQTQQQFMLLALAAVLITIVILLFIQYQILQRGFSHLEQIQGAIKKMQLGTKTPSLRQLPSEIQPLVEEIDRLLTQLTQRVQRSRNALGNLAHELKRPLQRYRSQLETLNPEQRLEGDSILQALHSTVERELKRAKIVGVSTPGRHTVIDDDLSHLIKVMQSIYPEKLIEAKYPEHLILPHDRDDMLELMGNLLDNACKYANSKVLINFEILDQGWQIAIEDDGDGVTQDSLKIITDRGVRLDESIQGHGLGLSICKDIVESYSGEMEFKAAKLGGLSVVILFPNIE